MLPKNNRLAQPPNAHWLPIASIPVQRSVALADAAKSFVWIGMTSDKKRPPRLNGIDAFWSPIDKQFNTADWPQHRPEGG